MHEMQENYAEIDPRDKLDEMITLLHGQTYEVFCSEDEEYDYLEDEADRCITLKNTAGNPLYIDIESEFTLTFGEWHAHYFGEEGDYEQLKNDLLLFLSNSACTVVVHCNDKWMGAWLMREEIHSKEEIKKEIRRFLHHPEFRAKMKEHGVQVDFRFWNPDYDRTMQFAPGEIR